MNLLNASKKHEKHRLGSRESLRQIDLYVSDSICLAVLTKRFMVSSPPSKEHLAQIRLAWLIKRVLREWKIELARTCVPDFPNSMLVLTKYEVRPLLKNLTALRMSFDVVSTIVSLIDMADRHNTYEKGFIDMSVGHCDWTFDVSSVDLHKSACRQKIINRARTTWLHSSVAVHYLHGIRRILDFIYNIIATRSD